MSAPRGSEPRSPAVVAGERRDGVRARFLVAFAVAIAVVGSGLFLERAVGVRPPEPAARSGAATGAWFCPHGGGAGWRVWVVAANPSSREAALRVTTFGPRGATGTRERLTAGTLGYVSVPAEEKASATMVEFFGPRVGVGMVAVRPEGGGLGAEPCAERAGTTWYVPEGSAVRGQSSKLVVLNPFAEEAVIDVTLFTKDGPIRPGRLSGVVMKPRRTTAFDLNEIALGREPVTAEVRASLGKVAVGGLDVASAGELRSILAVPRPAPTWILPGAGDDGVGVVSVMAPGKDEVAFQVRAQGAEAQVAVLEDGAVDAQAARTFEVEAEAAGLVVEAQGPEPFVAGRRLSSGVEPPQPPPPPPPKKGGKGRDRRERREPPPPPPPESTDTAATSGAPQGSAAWVAPPAVSPEGGRSFLVLENPGEEPVDAAISILTRDGSVPAPELSALRVPAGLTVTVDLSEVAGADPSAAVVRVTGGSLVVAQASLGPHGYAVALGVPMEPSWRLESLGI